MAHPKFVAAQAFGNRGETGERQVWEAIKRVFSPRECIVYWRYPIFSQMGKTRQEPDILIADRELGLIIIEIKSLQIEQIVSIVGHCWQLQNFYTRTIRPYEQAENQVYSLLEFSDREPTLQHLVTARALVALPQITQTQWQQREFHLLPTCPSIIFLEHLSAPNLLIQNIRETAPLNKGQILNREQWKLLLTSLGGAPIFQKATRKSTARQSTPVGGRRLAIAEANKQLLSTYKRKKPNFTQIPPGFQRIKGMTGCGKTTLLCQKAAYMHLQHPDWDIALVFFSRSLYQKILGQLDYWLSEFSNGEVEYNLHNHKLKVLHAWGGKDRAGLYSTICQSVNITPLKVDANQQRQPQEDLALACRDVLKKGLIKPIFEVILIDDAQDFLVKDEFKFEQQQPFFALGNRALKPVCQASETKRLIWADDPMLSREIGKSASASELFGDRCGQLVTGSYDCGIPKTIFLNRNHRTPEPILAVAMAIAMGLARPSGAIMGTVCASDWLALGYQIQRNFLQRLPPPSPHPIQELWKEPLLEFYTYSTRQAELTALAANIRDNLTKEGLTASQQILVIVLGSYFDAAKLEIEVGNFLIAQGIDIFIPGSKAPNILQPEAEQRDPSKFWHPGAVTISRMRRAKGNEADLVYAIGCDRIAQQGSSLNLRYQLFTALTRSKAWVRLSGIGENQFYREIRQLIDYKGKFVLPRHPLKNRFSLTEIGELLERYAAGDRNFAGIDLRGMQLTRIDLQGANLIGARLNGTDLSYARLDGAKLAIADLTDANLTGASLRKAKLLGAILDGTNLTDADLTHTDLTNIDI